MCFTYKATAQCKQCQFPCKCQLHVSAKRWEIQHTIAFKITQSSVAHNAASTVLSLLLLASLICVSNIKSTQTKLNS